MDAKKQKKQAFFPFNQDPPKFPAVVIVSKKLRSSWTDIYPVYIGYADPIQDSLVTESRARIVYNFKI